MITTPFLGLPGAMVQLPIPNGGDITVTPSRNDNAHALLNAGIAVTRRLNAKRSWALPYEGFDDDATPTADLLDALYEDVYGTGPLAYVHPGIANRLPLDVSTCGVRSNASHGWAASSGTLAVDTATASPVAGSAALKWSGMAASATLNPVIDATLNPVTLPGQPVTVSMYAKAAAAEGVQLAVVSLNSAGAQVTTASAAASLTTAWVRFTFTTTPTGSAGPYILPQIQGAPATTAIWIAAAQMEYESAATPWRRGFGSPRVHVAPPERTTPMYGWHQQTLTLTETG